MNDLSSLGRMRGNILDGENVVETAQAAFIYLFMELPWTQRQQNKSMASSRASIHSELCEWAWDKIFSLFQAPQVVL